MERQNLEAVNNENDLSDANRSLPTSSILGSLERLVETSFKPNNVDVVAQQVMLAKRALGSALDHDAELDQAKKRLKMEGEDNEANEDNEEVTDFPVVTTTRHVSRVKLEHSLNTA